MSFYMNMTLNEGKQAEVYKRKKFDAKYDGDNDPTYRKHRDDNRLYNAGAGYKMDHKRSSSDNEILYNGSPISKLNNSLSNSEKNQAIENETRHRAAIHKVMTDRGLKASTHDLASAVDTLDRHMRRHPKQYKESGIFSECNFIEFAY